MKLLLPADTPQFAFTLLETTFAITRSDILFFSWIEDVCCRKAILPSLPHNHYRFHPAMGWCADQMKSMAGSFETRVPKKLFVSRARVANSKRATRLANEAQLIEALAQSGFEIVFPEQSPWTEQIAIFSRAAVVVGESGSALHNTLFSPPGATVLCLAPHNRTQATICALRNQIFVPVSPKSVEGDSYTVDVDAVRKAAIQADVRSLPEGDGFTQDIEMRLRWATRALETRTKALRSTELHLKYREAALHALATRHKLFFTLMRKWDRFFRFTGRLFGRERTNPYFDAAFYVRTYPHVLTSHLDPYSHYLTFGADEGLNPSADFDTAFYLASNPDVRKAGVNPLEHFYRSGRFEGRLPKPG